MTPIRTFYQPKENSDIRYRGQRIGKVVTAEQTSDNLLSIVNWTAWCQFQDSDFAAQFEDPAVTRRPSVLIQPAGGKT